MGTQDVLKRDDDDPLYRAALAVEQDARLSAEMAEWDCLAADGLADDSHETLTRA
jgi:hypothetical protein